MSEVNKVLEEQGCIVTTFPQGLKQIMTEEILSRFLGYKVENFEMLETGLSQLNKEEFSKVIPKANRSFSSDVSESILNWVEASLDLDQLLGKRKRSISGCSVDEVKLGKQLKLGDRSVYWRTVRPNQETDVGAAHRDSTFWEIETAAGYDPLCPFDYKERWKVWIPLFGCDSSNSLQLVKGSHSEFVPTLFKKTDKGTKPFVDDTWLTENSDRFDCLIDDFKNDCVIFHDDLVHQAPINKAKNIRVSAEFTILVE